MECPDCRQENSPSARFCIRCGTALRAVCPHCGAELPPPARFCPECGAARTSHARADVTSELLSREQWDTSSLPVPEPEETLAQNGGENRLATVLFVDMSGFVQSTSRLHAEDAAMLVNRLLQAMVAVIAKYEGRVDRFLGDGVLAVFGVPRAHESDPERAIHAAIEIQAAARRVGVEVTAGINTGEVYVGALGAEENRVVTVMGPVVNLASRLQGKAEPSQILIGEATHRHTRRAFEFSPLSLILKGFEHPVTAYSVVRPLPRPEKPRGIEGLYAPLIGREEELARLQATIARLLQGQGQLVTLIGEAGIGKSRLVAEVKAEVSGPPSLLWLEGRCLEQGMNASYSLFVDLFRNYLAGRLGPGEPLQGAVLAAALQEFVTGGELAEEQAAEMLSLLANLLSVASNDGSERLNQLSPEQLRHQTIRAVEQFFVLLSRRQPVVLLLEDLHWVDSSSFDLLSFLLGTVMQASLCLLCVYRPEREAASFSGGETRCSQLGSLAAQQCAGQFQEIYLRELTLPQCRRLAESLLGMRPLPAAVEVAVLERAHGNPFFVEEVMRSLIASGMLYREEADAKGGMGGWRVRAGTGSFPVPETIQSLILSRVDRLDRRHRLLLQSAAVIGHSFPRKVLEYLSPGSGDLRQALAELGDHQLIDPARVGSEEEYAFRHVLTQATIYATILRRRRAGLHRKVAEAIERLYSDHLEQVYEQLAQHYMRSDALAEAVDYLLKAGRKAMRMYANQEALRCFEQARECYQRLSAGERDARIELSIHEALGEVLFRMGAHREAEIQFQEALNLALARVDAREQAALAVKLADSIQWQGQPDRAVAVAEAGLAVLGQDRFSPEAVNLLEVMMRSSWAKDDLESARHYADRIRQILPQVPYFDSLYMIHYGIAWLKINAGDFTAAEEWLQVMERTCVEHQNENGLARCYHGLGDLERARGNYERAAHWFSRSLEYCERTGDAHLLLEGHGERAQALILADGDPGEIETHIQRMIDIAAEMARAGGVSSLTSLFERLGKAFAERGDSEKALLYLHRALDVGAAPHPERILCQLEQIYVRLGRHQEFFDYCRRTQEAQSDRSGMPLRYWHLTPGSPDRGFTRLLWQDSFEQPVLRDEWRWVNPGARSSHTLLSDPARLELRSAPVRDFPRVDRNAPCLLRPLSGEAAVLVRLVDIRAQECHAAGLLLYTSRGNYLAFGRINYLAFGKMDAIANEVSLQVCREDRLETVARGWLPGTELHLRLERRGHQVFAWCSNDGMQWQSCGEALISEEEPLQAGLYVACAPTMPVAMARFEEFRIIALGDA